MIDLTTEGLEVHCFDPGKRTGYVKFVPSIQPFPMTVGTFSRGQLYQILDELPSNRPLVIVYEDYIIDTQKKSGFSHRWNTGEPLRVIGSIEYRADQLGLVEKETLIKQQRSVRKIGAGYGKIPYKEKGHDPDHLSAMMHGYYYMVNVGLLQPRS